MLKLNLREARDILARRLQEVRVGPAGAEAGTGSSMAAAEREAAILLAEVDVQFFA